MKRLARKLFTLLLLASLGGSPLMGYAHAAMAPLTPPCPMSMSGDTGMAPEDCPAAQCERCSSCVSCVHCVGTAAVGQHAVAAAEPMHWRFGSYVNDFLSVYPPVDSPPPRQA